MTLAPEAIGWWMAAMFMLGLIGGLTVGWLIMKPWGKYLAYREVTERIRQENEELASKLNEMRGE